jgi:hypothetical protein
MTIYELKDKDGRIFAFEVDNVLLSRRGVCRILRSVPGVRILRAPRFLSRFREEEFCEFELGGRRFKAWEPFGDNSRYWIGPEPAQWCEQVDLVRDAFVRHSSLRLGRA